MAATVIPDSISWLQGPDPLLEYLVVDVFTPRRLRETSWGCSWTAGPWTRIRCSRWPGR